MGYTVMTMNGRSGCSFKKYKIQEHRGRNEDSRCCKNDTSRLAFDFSDHSWGKIESGSFVLDDPQKLIGSMTPAELSGGDHAFFGDNLSQVAVANQYKQLLL